MAADSTEIVTSQDYPAIAIPAEDSPVTSTTSAAVIRDALSPLEEDDVLAVRAGIRKFNRDPKQGIVWLEAQGIIDHTPEDYARFFSITRGITRRAVCGLLRNPDEFASSVVEAMLARLDFTDRDLIACLLELAERFYLVEQAELLNCLMECFGAKYHRENPGRFHTEVGAWVLAFSCMLLAGDLYATRRRFVSLDAFRDPLRGRDGDRDGDHDFDPDYLAALYNSVAADTGRDLVALHSFRGARKQGWLRIPSYWLLPWTQRWYVLCDNSLYMCEEEGGEWTSKVDLGQMMVRPVAGGRQWSFELHHFVGGAFAVERNHGQEQMEFAREIVLGAENETDMLAWLAVLNEVVMTEKDVLFEMGSMGT